MIIKITFKDNDYTQLIERYLDSKDGHSFTSFSRILNHWLSEEDYSMVMSTSNTRELFMDYIRNGIKKLSLTDKLAFEEMLYTEFMDWLKENSTSYDYLKDSLKITITNKMTSKWENGEMVYYFPSQHKYIIQ